MLFRMIYDDRLAQAAYLIGCQRTGEAILIDPERDIDRYLAVAAKEKVRITAVAETHIHADFLSGAREVAEKTGAHLYLSGEGGPDWQYQWLQSRSSGGAYAHTLLRDGTSFSVGNIEIRAIHTPGHTPEHMCFLVTDRGGGASEPMGIATGDFVFVGDLGRPDLLETAAGQAGSKEPAARALFRSVGRFNALADYLQVWPAHGAGSACGKALGAVPQTTVGYERRFNPSIKVAGAGESEFVHSILTGQPDPPVYFARMKRDNKLGPAILGALPRPGRLGPADAAALDASSIAVIDMRPWKEFKAAHIPGALWIPMDSMFPTVAGSFVGEDEPMYLCLDPGQNDAALDEAIRCLIRVGLDDIRGWFHAGEMPAVLAARQAARPGDGQAESRVGSIAEVSVQGARADIESSKYFLLDVRNESEFVEGHLPGAYHTPYTRLADQIDQLPTQRNLLVSCKSGGRSGRACAYLKRAGYTVTNLAGGFDAWIASGAPTER